MIRTPHVFAVAAALLTAGLLAVSGSQITTHAQSSGGATRPLPQFEVDRGWPALPATMKIGDASSFAVDAKDRVLAAAPAADDQARGGQDRGAARRGVRRRGRRRQDLGW